MSGVAVFAKWHSWHIFIDISMHHRLIICISAFFGIVLFLSCHQGKVTDSAQNGDTVAMKYAENICIVHYEGYTRVDLANPWKKGEILHTYILIPSHESFPLEGRQEGATYITIPLARSAVYSGVHGSIIDELGAADRIRAVCEVEYFTNEHILSAYRAGRITNLGNSLAPDIEALIDIHPDAILLSPFENSGGYGLIETVDIPIVECADYMETSPLGRAEWMKFYGLLYGRAAEADSLFHEVETAYNTLKALATPAKERPRVISDLITGSTWYVPGGHSTMGRLITDAGGDYIFRDRHESGSLALSPETVFAESQDADVWFMKYTNHAADKTYRELNDYMNQLIDSLRMIPSVGKMTVHGMQKDQISIYLNSDKLSHYGISYMTIGQILTSKGFVTTAGRLKNEGYKSPIYVDHALNKIYDVENTVIYTDANGNAVRLKDVATVKREYAKKTSY